MVEKRYICDRCGRDKSMAVRVDFPMKIAKRKVEHVAWVRLNCATGYRYDLELCQDCMEGLVRFLNNEPTFTDPSDMDQADS